MAHSPPGCAGPPGVMAPAHLPSPSDRVSTYSWKPHVPCGTIPLQLAASEELISLLRWAPPELLVCQDRYQTLDCCRCKAEVGARERWTRGSGTAQSGWQTNPVESLVTIKEDGRVEKGGSSGGRLQPTASTHQPS